MTEAFAPAVPLRPARPDVIDETFDGEAVLVHLVTGCYYALNPAASAIWALLSPGRSAAGVTAALAARHATDPAQVAVVVDTFLAELRTEQLVVVADADADAHAPTDAAEPEGDAGPLGVPALQRFTDLQDLLMLDPIHDIDLDGDGWPLAAQPDGPTGQVA